MPAAKPDGYSEICLQSRHVADAGSELIFSSREGCPRRSAKQILFPRLISMSILGVVQDEGISLRSLYYKSDMGI